jgi:hypothetical protein
MSNKKKAEPKAEERKRKYDVDKVLELWTRGLSIREIADKMSPISRIYVHRVLSTRFPKQYAEGQKQRAAEREAARSAQ